MPVIPNLRKSKLRYIAAAVSVALATLVLIPLRGHVNSAGVSLCFLLVVLFSATLFGSGAALMSSILSALCLNFFFLPPFYTLNIAEPENWIALFVFLCVSLIVGQLSSIAGERAEEAERLYEDLHQAFEKASHAEAIERNEKLKTALLDAVTHDLRTPLTSMKAAITMLIEEHGKRDIHVTLEPEGRGDLLAVINEETDRLNDFVESMVELARIEAGDVAWSKTPASAEEIISNALQRSSRLTARHRVEVKLAPDLPPMEVDSKAVAEVLFNLIDNAVKYSPENKTIVIEAARMDGKIRFSIEDEGVGIPESERENIFRKFYRVDKSVKGLGMGLAIVRGIIEAHGGSIRVEPGKNGSRFVFDLPEKTNE